MAQAPPSKNESSVAGVNNQASSASGKKTGTQEAVAKVVAPQLLGNESVAYPAGASGDAVVALKLLIHADGTVRQSLIVEGEEPFASQAREAALTWTFSPAKLDDQPKSSWIIYRVEFLASREAVPPPVSLKSAQAFTESSETEDESAVASEPEAEVSVFGERISASARVMSDSETFIIPGAEGDPIRALGILPGTVPIIGSGPFIGLRGAPPGMVGYEFDGISLPYLFHLAGGTAVVHPWLVDSATIYGTGGPARLGRSGGGVIEAKAAEPAGYSRAGARIRITDTALGAEAPLAEGKGSVLLAGRYSYTKPLVSAIAPEFSLDYWDYQGKLRYQLTQSNSVEVLAFGAGDKSSTVLDDGTTDDLFRASFHRASVRYVRSMSTGEFYRVGATFGHDRWDAGPGPIRPYLYSVSLRLDAHVPLASSLNFNYGGDLNFALITDYYYQSQVDELAQNAQSEKRTDHSSAAWFDWSWQVAKYTELDWGVRLDLYENGESERAVQSVKLAFQPRLSLSHAFSHWARLHQSVGFSSQRPSPSQRPPGRQYAVNGGIQRSALSDLGVEWKLPAGVRFDTTAFHNVYFNTRDISDIHRLEGQPSLRPRGQGQSLGLEVSLKRTFAEKFRAFVSYTLSRSWRSIGRVRHLAQYDRPHVLDVAMAYHLGKGWDVSARGTFYSGFHARATHVDAIAHVPRVTSFYQVDWQVAKRWESSTSGRWWGLTMGVLNTTLNSEVNDSVCREGFCVEDVVGPATIPTIGVEGEL